MTTEDPSDEPSGDLIARSRAMRNVLTLAQRIAQSDAPVLLTGESGVGKERIARYLHAASRRARGAYMAVNCAALPEQLLESELFGHVRGAFTGADREKKGLFEAAAGGNRDLAEMIRERAFRKDLYFRLKVLVIEVPPLRDRREDVLPLAHAFMRRGCATYHCGPCSLSPAALDHLLAYAWPGNVRELEHAMERAVVLAEGKPKIEAGDLPPEIAGEAAGRGADEGGSVLPLAEVERRHILHALEKMGGNRKETARVLGIGANTLWRKLRQYGPTMHRERE